MSFSLILAALAAAAAQPAASAPPVEVVIPTAPRPIVTFDRAAEYCYRLADRYSSEAASSAEYDGDSVGGGIGAMLSGGIERKRIRKRLYVRCMDANGFYKAKYVKFKSRPGSASR